jgi:hypothetical protein
MDWAERSMKEAIHLLDQTGRDDLASDLRRLLTVIPFEDLEVLRSPLLDRIATEIAEATSLLDLAELLARISEALGVAHVTLHVISEAPLTNFSTKVLTTYPNRWVTRYVDRRHFLVDPVHRACLSGETGFFWSGLERSAPVLRSFWADAIAHGIGPSGYTQLLTSERGDRLALSICSEEEETQFRDRILRNESDLFCLGIFLTEVFSRLASDHRPTAFNPTDDQFAILRAVATGVDEAELEHRTYQYGSYKTLKRSICELFHTKTVAQAAVLAARIGLLADAPLTKADILANLNASGACRLQLAAFPAPRPAEAGAACA